MRLLIPVFLFLSSGMGFVCSAETTRADLDRLLESSVHDWLFKQGEVPGAEAPAYDDSDWEVVDLGHQWWPNNSTCWYRKKVIIPEKINGIAVAGSTVCMRVGLDNEAKAYLNGEFKQQFEWHKGDFLLAENAQPGATVTVALYGINRQGYGSLYDAYLVSSSGEEMVEALRRLLEDYDAAESYVEYGPEEGSPHWRRLLQASMQQLDLAAYRDVRTIAFLESIEQARRKLLSDKRGFAEDCERISRKLTELKEAIAQGRAKGSQLAYQQADARVVESFLQYVRDDLDDGETRHAIRALTTVRFLEDTCDEALAKAKEILTDPGADLRVSTYRTGPVETRDGGFWQEGRPVFFTGVGHFGQVRQDIPILNDYGLNIVQIEMGPNSVVLGPDRIADEPIRKGILPTLDNAAEHNVAVNMLISPHYFPEWALERYPELRDCGYGFTKHCIDAPEARQIYETYLRTLMPLIADHPALQSICLSNEPQYDGRCRHSLEKFRRWIENKYATVAALNETAGTHVESFQEAAFPDDSSDYAFWHDYYRFNQDRFLEFHEFLRDLIHEFDTDLPVHAKAMSHAFAEPEKFQVGVDYEAFTLLGTIAGNDCVQTFRGDEPSEYLQRWQDMALNYTFQHSVAPDEPIFNSEDHIIPDGEPRYVPASHIRTAYWMQALHGQGAATAWVWERAQGGDFSENILTRAACVRALGHVGLDLNRLAPEVHALQQAKADVAILYAFSSMLPSHDFTEEAAAAFEGLSFCDTTCDFVTERQAWSGKLRDYRLIVVPNASHVPNAVFSAVQDYIQQGGAVLLTGECFTHDMHGRPRDERLSQTGSGHLISYSRRLTSRAYREILDDLLDLSGCVRPVRLKGKYGEPVWGVNLRTVQDGSRRLVNLVNYGRHTQIVMLETEPPYDSIVDLFGNQTIDLPLVVRPLDPVLLALEGTSD